MLRALFIGCAVAVCSIAMGQEKKTDPSKPEAPQEDKFQVGSKWTGTYAKTWIVKRKKEFESSDLEFNVTKRSGKDFTAEWWGHNHKSGVVVEGTIDKNHVQFRATKWLTPPPGDKGSSLIDNNVFSGKLDKGLLTGTMTKPKTDSTYRGEVKLKLKEG